MAVYLKVGSLWEKSRHLDAVLTKSRFDNDILNLEHFESCLQYFKPL